MELKAGAKILAEVARGAEVPGADKAVQVDLPLVPAEVLDALPDETIARQQALRVTGKGRPKGAINRATADWRDFILSRYRSPLVVLAETYSRPVHDLAAELGCSKLEAMQLQQRAAVELAPYVHGKMPVDISISGDLPMLVMADPRSFLAEQPGEGFGLADLQEIQEVSEDV